MVSVSYKHLANYLRRLRYTIHSLSISSGGGRHLKDVTLSRGLSEIQRKNFRKVKGQVQKSWLEILDLGSQVGEVRCWKEN